MTEFEPALRSDYLLNGRRRRDTRAAERLIAHYRLERTLADLLRHAPKERRTQVYSDVYSELFNSLPDHPQTLAKQTTRAASVARELKLLARHIQPEFRFLEIGCGDAALSFAMAPKVREAHGLDVTAALLPTTLPENFTFVRTSGVDIALRDQSIDVAYSNQLVEHLHPDDVVAQFREIYRILAPGGVYRCSTPSRVSGPHDVSVYFDYEASGLHLREYEYLSLRELFLAAGFSSVRFFVTGGSRQFAVPYRLGRLAETSLSVLPIKLRARVAALPFVRHVLGLTAVGRR